MQSACDHPKEKQRLETLLAYEILDSEDEKAFDELTELASTICGTPISLISLVDDHRQWFKSRIGLDATETPKEIAFCSHAILQGDVFEVTNAEQDPRFYDNPLVTGDPDIRFYAGSPLIAPNGSPIGTLCVIDRTPRTLTEDQKRALEILAKQVVGQLELRLHNHQLQRLNNEQSTMIATISHDLRSPFNAILGLTKILTTPSDTLTAEKISRIAKNVLASSMTVYQMLDEMLQWASRRYAGSAVKKQVLPLLKLTEMATELQHEAITLKELDFQIHIDSKLNVLADPTLIKSVIRNLLNNAIKFTPERGLIKLTATAVGEEISLCMSNSGSPIPQELREKLFNTQVDSSTGTVGEKGLGLGLTLCQEFMALQGGSIYLQDSNDTATIFTIRLPLSN